MLLMYWRLSKKKIIYNNNYFFIQKYNINVQEWEQNGKTLSTSTLNLVVWNMLTMLTNIGNREVVIGFHDLKCSQSFNSKVHNKGLIVGNIIGFYEGETSMEGYTHYTDRRKHNWLLRR